MSRMQQLLEGIAKEGYLLAKGFSPASTSKCTMGRAGVGEDVADGRAKSLVCAMIDLAAELNGQKTESVEELNYVPRIL